MSPNLTLFTTSTLVQATHCHLSPGLNGTSLLTGLPAPTLAPHHPFSTQRAPVQTWVRRHRFSTLNPPVVPIFLQVRLKSYPCPHLRILPPFPLLTAGSRPVLKPTPAPAARTWHSLCPLSGHCPPHFLRAFLSPLLSPCSNVTFSGCRSVSIPIPHTLYRLPTFIFFPTTLNILIQSMFYLFILLSFFLH